MKLIEIKLEPPQVQQEHEVWLNVPTRGSYISIRLSSNIDKDTALEEAQEVLDKAVLIIEEMI